VTATGIAAGAGAAQLGLAYGLGIVAWQPVRDATGESLWLAGLAWTLWISASSTVLGAVYTNAASTRAARAKTAVGSSADRADGRRRTRGADVVTRTVIAFAAAIGALITVPLVVLPARAAQRADTFRPEVTAGAYAVLGVIVGLVIAIVAVNIRVIAANIAASTTWVGALAAVAVVDAVRANRTVGTAQLAAWQFADRGWFRETLHLPAVFAMLGGALLVGVLAALPADRRGDNRVAIAVSGTFGPLLVAAAYLLTAPSLTPRVEQLSSYLFAPYGMIAGLAGSVFVAVLAPLRPRRTSMAPVSPAVRYATPTGGAAASGTAPVTRAAPDAGTASADDTADLTYWTRTLAADRSEQSAGTSFPESPPATGVHPVTTGIYGLPPAASGRASVTESPSPTVTQPGPPPAPKPRQRRGFGDPARW
jgi:hypothetical protein